MSTATPISAQQLLKMPQDGKRHELVAGELRMMLPSGWKHGEVVSELHILLGRYIKDNALGRLFSAETGFLIASDPDTVRAPDIAFIAKENLPTIDPSDAFWPGAPDLAVEVLSPSDRTGEVDEKIQDWLNAGVRLVWIVDPKLCIVTAYRSATDVATHTADDELKGGQIVAGFRCMIADIFPLTDSKRP